MVTQYDIEHGIKRSATPSTKPRRVDMSSFNAHFSNTFPTEPNHQNPHATANPADISALFRLLQDQFGILASDASDPENRRFLESLVQELEEDVLHPPQVIESVSEETLASLERIDRKKLKDDETCHICRQRFLDDPYCLVVELPCHKSHRFDLECIESWLRLKPSCPLCRAEVGKKKVVAPPPDDDEEDDDMNGLYG
ncbi:hypothetical protein QBC38DRAFT_115574 [Podospora fimiseda]|uniref:RING-type domain-containing protein n=1 Tax=Podospora fimiseda TaxID=252190 RepID=A0AAN7BU07_9PEZI|nr:hypothetical protein QBC38DRAFT_115574 [Podospora fimiseda]